jgi:hypothetical protein
MLAAMRVWTSESAPTWRGRRSGVSGGAARVRLRVWGALCLRRVPYLGLELLPQLGRGVVDRVDDLGGGEGEVVLPRGGGGARVADELDERVAVQPDDRAEHRLHREGWW